MEQTYEFTDNRSVYLSAQARIHIRAMRDRRWTLQELSDEFWRIQDMRSAAIERFDALIDTLHEAAEVALDAIYAELDGLRATIDSCREVADLITDFQDRL